jgi:hypothetical protein
MARATGAPGAAECFPDPVNAERFPDNAECFPDPVDQVRKEVEWAGLGRVQHFFQLVVIAMVGHGCPLNPGGDPRASACPGIGCDGGGVMWRGLG